MSDPNAFSKLVPGFDFMQTLVKNAGAALPGIGQWVAPTLNPEELEKRINELRTVQFWLEQNARMLGATIQALEVQRMTLSTLKTMNVQMGDLRDSLTMRMPDAAAKPAAAAAKSETLRAGWPRPEATKPAPSATPSATPGEAPAAVPPATAAVDPMQWWTALTQQFTQLAANAMKVEHAAGLNAADTASAAASAAVPPVSGAGGPADGPNLDPHGAPATDAAEGEAPDGRKVPPAARKKPAVR